MRAGLLDQRLKLYQTINSKTPSGALTKSLSLPLAVWGKAEQEGASRDNDNDRDLTLNRYLFTSRYRTNIKAGDWLSWRSKLLHIDSIDDSDPKRAVIIISAQINPNPNANAPPFSLEQFVIDTA